jgi:transitional endoplasmic reticulum ATPase
MSEDESQIAGLQAALKVSPDNAPLRLMLGKALLKAGRAAEAEAELREALKQGTQEGEAGLPLAQSLLAQGKDDHAELLLESLVDRGLATAHAKVEYSKMLLEDGEEGRASVLYGEAVASDPSVAEADLSAKLGARPGKTLAMLSGGDSAAMIDESLKEIEEGYERPKIHFADVGGMDALKEQISLKIIHPLKNPEIYKSYGKASGGGILFYGPPGCGKTHLARATAGEIEAGFMGVGIQDILDMYVGESEKKLHEIFRTARSLKPFVLFFDEVDAIAANRKDLRASAAKTTVNQFLAELDGAGASNDGVLVLGATNAPWHLDPAFRRPGRFDRVLFVPPPDLEGRESILKLHLQGKPAENVDFKELAKKTGGFSGADLRGLVDQAVEKKILEAMKSGKTEPIRTTDLIASLKVVKPSTKEWLATARNYALYSNQGGQYNDILEYLKTHEPEL